MHRFMVADKDYFRVMGYTVQTGRLFEDQDWTGVRA